MKSKKCSVETCNNPIFSKGLCKFHIPKKKKLYIDFNTEDLEKLSLSDLKRTADYWLRQYLLRDKGVFIKCPIKNRDFYHTNMHVAHFINRDVLNTRYDLDNCHLISEQSNVWDAQIPKEGYKSLHHYDYEMWLGEEKVKILLEKSKIIRKFVKEDYIEIINKFRDEC